MTSRSTDCGTFKNGIPYARIGEGKKNLLLFYGGPGNLIPTDWLGSQILFAGLKPLMTEYYIHVVSRKSGLPEGFTTRDMSDDYAELIQQEFAGHVDVVIGMSCGGMIAQHFAADHADRCDHVVIAMSTHKLTEAGKRVDTRFAELISKGKNRSAAVTIAEVMYPSGVGRWLVSAVMWLLGGSIISTRTSTYKQDVLIEAEAEVTHESVEKTKFLFSAGGLFGFYSATASLNQPAFSAFRLKGLEILYEQRAYGSV